MKVITKTLYRSNLLFRDAADASAFGMTQADWLELGKPDRIVVHISVPDLTQEDRS